MEIETGRFLLRDFTEADRPAFLAYRADPRFAAVREPGDAEIDRSDALLDLFIDWACQQPRRNFQLAVVRKRSSDLIGCCGLREAGCPEGAGEVGIEFSPDVWSRHGYAVEIAQALLTLAFRERGLERVVGVTTAANLRVARLAEWFGGRIVEGREEVKWEIAREHWRETP